MFQFDFSAIHDRVSNWNFQLIKGNLENKNPCKFYISKISLINPNSEVRKNIKQSAFANLLFTRLKKNIIEISEFEIHETS